MASPKQPSIELARRAARDLRKLDGTDRRRVRSALDALAAGAENLDVKAVAGHSPWLRLRVGELRVLYRPLTPAEVRALKTGRGWLVARVIARGDLERIVSSLGPVP
jgi:mRNA-degrading endonuclease RelE of RelBE toxin-antitoxin system